jgi:hypothetical protein
MGKRVSRQNCSDLACSELARNRFRSVPRPLGVQAACQVSLLRGNGRRRPFISVVQPDHEQDIGGDDPESHRGEQRD